MLVGRAVAASSPQGRFAEGAARLDGRTCEAVEAWGKHLVYDFGDALNLHVHLGLFGRIRVLPTGTEPEGEVRARLATMAGTVGINGPTACEVLDPAQVAALVARIGPDPLRPDADPERAWVRIAKSRAPIGLLLMDQSVVAGIGNIYRTELLWRARAHPALPGRQLGRERWEALWADARRLLEVGVERGLIVTRNEDRTPAKTFRGRVNVFKKPRCPRCRSAVTGWTMATRRVFACETCAPPPGA